MFIMYQKRATKWHHGGLEAESRGNIIHVGVCKDRVQVTDLL